MDQVPSAEMGLEQVAKPQNADFFFKEVKSFEWGQKLSGETMKIGRFQNSSSFYQVPRFIGKDEQIKLTTIDVKPMVRYFYSQNVHKRYDLN